MGAVAQEDARTRAGEEMGAGGADDAGADNDDVRAPGRAEGGHVTLNPRGRGTPPPPVKCCEMGYLRLRDV